jgi:putative amide transporter protein
VAYNNIVNAGGRAFGWYCLFVAITAIPAGIYTLVDANGNGASVYLAIDWFAWALLWLMFFLLLALDRPIARATGLLAILEGIGTAWVFAILILQGELAF